ncbi:Hypothetical protein, putative, partial [Bodo saltans]
VSVLY